MPQVIKDTTTKKDKQYYQAIGRRKTASAQVRITLGKGQSSINHQEIDHFDQDVLLPLIITGQSGKFDISAVVTGGGMTSQKDAIKLGIARALIVFDANLKSSLRKAGLVTRDPREKERKKPGLKRARKAPQWSKR